MKNILFHILGHPDKPLDLNRYPEDAQLRTCFTFCQMLHYLGHRFIYYGLPGSVLPPQGEFVSIGKPTARWQWQNSWHKLYTKRLNRALQAHCPQKGRQIVASLYGAAHAEIECPGLPILEPMVGYNHCWAPFCVFPSRCQQNVIYSTTGRKLQFPNTQDRVIPHFLNLKEYPFSASDEGYLLYLGRNLDLKGTEIVKQIAAAADLPVRMEFTGWHGKAKTDLLGKAKAVLVPTLYPEPFGYVTAEAMLCGTPVLASDWGAFPEYIQHGKTGFLCHTLNDFLHAISKIDLLDRTIIRQTASNLFSMENAAAKYQLFFQDILNSTK